MLPRVVGFGTACFKFLGIVALSCLCACDMAIRRLQFSSNLLTDAQQNNNL